MILNPLPDAGQIEQAVERASASGWAALLHFNWVESFDPDAVATRTELVALAEAIVDAGVPLTFVSLGSPYILPAFTRQPRASAATAPATPPFEPLSRSFSAVGRPTATCR